MMNEIAQSKISHAGGTLFLELCINKRELDSPIIPDHRSVYIYPDLD